MLPSTNRIANMLSRAIIASVSTNDLRIVASLKVHILSVAVALESVFGEKTALVKKVNNK